MQTLGRPFVIVIAILIAGGCRGENEIRYGLVQRWGWWLRHLRLHHYRYRYRYCD
jgi:hypothetical protein